MAKHICAICGAEIGLVSFCVPLKSREEIADDEGVSG